MALPTPERLRGLIRDLEAGLLEREAATRTALLAALAGEHVLLIGPPGTAKSELARRLHRAFAGARYFERLLTRFSTPEELFGPLSLKALEHDRYERLVEGWLPTAGIAFLDEVFKANSAILNALLTLLNERQFDNGTERIDTPLVCVVAASNEVPSDEALHAFYDRFLVRVPVAPVGDSSFGALLALGETPAPATERLTPAERAVVEQAAALVTLGEEFVAACSALRQWIAGRGAALSDRRWRQFVALARTAAATEGRPMLDRFDLWLAPYVASPRPEDFAAYEAWFEDEVVGAPPTVAPWLARAVEAFEKQLGIEQQTPDDSGDDGAGKLALARAIGMADAGSGMQRIVSARLEAQLKRRWGARHIEARVAQVAEVEAQIAAAAAEVAGARSMLAAALHDRLWMPPDLVTRLLARYDLATTLLADFAARLAAARTGFADLPCDPGDEGVEPAPMAFEAAA